MTDTSTEPDVDTPAAAVELTYNEAGTHVFVTNEATGGYWECPVDYLPIARVTGWAPCERRDDSLAGLFDPGVVTGLPAVAEVTGFNPDDHNVPEVNDHLAQHAESSPGEVARVLELEAAGQNRKGIVEGPFAPQPDPVDGDSADGDTNTPA